MTVGDGRSAEAAATVFDRRAGLREFLRSRRARLSPVDVGLAPGGRRRTPGLRREEVATLAGVGVSWYTWLEQGRDISASASVLDAVSAALRLSESERAHLHLLAGASPPVGGDVDDSPVPPELLQLVAAWAPRPAMLQDRYWNLLAINSGTREVFGYSSADHNCLISFFTNERYRGAYVEWSAAAPGWSPLSVPMPAATWGPQLRGDRRPLEFRESRFRGNLEPPRCRSSSAGCQSGPSPGGGRARIRQDHPHGHRPPGMAPRVVQPRPETGTDTRLSALMGQ